MNTYVIIYLYVYIQRFTYVEIFDIYDQLVTIGMSTLHLLISLLFIFLSTSSPERNHA